MAVALPVLVGAVESPQASTLSGGQVVITGGVVSWFVTVIEQMLAQPLVPVTFKVRVKVEPQTLPADTCTVWVLVDPVIVPLPLMDHS